MSETNISERMKLAKWMDGFLASAYRDMEIDKKNPFYRISEHLKSDEAELRVLKDQVAFLQIENIKARMENQGKLD